MRMKRTSSPTHKTTHFTRLSACVLKAGEQRFLFYFILPAGEKKYKNLRREECGKIK